MVTARERFAQRILTDDARFEALQLAEQLLSAFRSAHVSDEIIRGLLTNRKPLWDFAASLTGVRRIHNIDFSRRARKALLRLGIGSDSTVAELFAITEDQLKQIKNCGELTVSEIFEKMEQEKANMKKGLSFL